MYKRQVYVIKEEFMQEVALMDFYEKTISSQQIFAGRIINVKVDTVTLPDGSTSTREIVSHAGAVAVIPIDQEGMVWMVRQLSLIHIYHQRIYSHR